MNTDTMTQTPPHEMTLEAIKEEIPTANAREEAALDAYFLRPASDTYAAMEAACARACALRNEKDKRHFSIEAVSLTKLDGGRIAYSFTAAKTTLDALEEMAGIEAELENDPARALYCLLFSAFERLEERNSLMAEY